MWGRRRHTTITTRLRSVMPDAPPASASAAAAAATAAGRRKIGAGPESGPGGSDPWEGHKHGFDWQLERARRTLEGPAFAPFRMDYWKPPTVGGWGLGCLFGSTVKVNHASSHSIDVTQGEEGQQLPAEERRVGLADSLKIMVTNAYQLLTGSRGLDGAPVADVGKYNVRY